MSLNDWQIYLAEELEEYVSFWGSGDDKPSSMLLSHRQSIGWTHGRQGIFWDQEMVALQQCWSGSVWQMNQVDILTKAPYQRSMLASRSFAPAALYLSSRYFPTHSTRWSLNAPFTSWWRMSGVSSWWISVRGKSSANGFGVNVNKVWILNPCKRTYNYVSINTPFVPQNATSKLCFERFSKLWGAQFTTTAIQIIRNSYTSILKWIVGGARQYWGITNLSHQFCTIPARRTCSG